MRKFPLALMTVLLIFTGCQKAAPEITTVQPTVVPPIPVSQKIESAENYCLSCHTDKEQLIATAKPEEIVESESSGAG